MFSLARFIGRNKQDRYISGDDELPTIVLIDIDKGSLGLENILTSMGVSIWVMTLESEFSNVKGIYSAGLVDTRNKLANRVYELIDGSYRVLVSSDLDNKVRDFIDVCNGHGVSTSLLNLDSYNDGTLQYRNYREGYDYPIVDHAMFLDSKLEQEVRLRQKGPSKFSCVGVENMSTIPASYPKKMLNNGAFNSAVLLESLPGEYVSLMVDYAVKYNIKVFVRVGLLSKDARKALKNVEFVGPGIEYKKIRQSVSGVYGVVDGRYCFSCSNSVTKLTGVDTYLLMLSDLGVTISSNASSLVSCALNKELFIEGLLSPLEKNEYKTLVLYLKKGDNLFGSLRYYPKMLGCNNHIIYRGGDVEGDIYASFGLPDDKIQLALKKLAQKKSLLNGKGESLYYNIENGFLAFTGIALLDSAPSHSLLLDNKSLYFDGVNGSSTEDKILLQKKPSEKNLLLAKHCISKIVEYKLSKYNHAPTFIPKLPGVNTEKVLIIDQRFADKSIGYARASEATFDRMLMDAYRDNPNSDIIVKVHPDALTGLVKGHFDKCVEYLPRVYLYAENINPISLLQAVDSVYVVSSQMGFEALMLGLPVYIYGNAIYGGWGLTHDRIEFSRRGEETRSLYELFYWLYIDGVPYVDPSSGRVVDIETYIYQLANFTAQESKSLPRINVGEGHLLKNTITNDYFVIKNGKLGVNTIIGLCRDVDSIEEKKSIVLSLDKYNQLPENSEIFSDFVKFLNNSISEADLEYTLLTYAKLNDLFNFLTAFYSFLDESCLIKVIDSLCQRSNSETLIEKVLFWSFCIYKRNCKGMKGLEDILDKNRVISLATRLEIANL